jgi:hypothetical protein
MTMKPNGDLIVYKNRGRPTKEESRVMKCSEELKREVLALKKQMAMDGDKEVLVALAVASDKMIRHVMMFPEVFFMDVTANTNRQKRDLFVMVVKDASGEAYPANLTIIPSGQMWVFMKIYQTFFLELYGEVTISRNRLALTDDDKSEHGPLDNLIATSDHWNKSHHMLCIFHSIVKAFHEQVHPLLPAQTRDKKRKLTKRGRVYCESFFCATANLLTHVRNDRSVFDQ